MMDIKVILKKLSEKRSVFHMEADFQLALFREIAEVLGTSKDIYLEHLEGGKHIDIYIKNENMDTALEIKYKTTFNKKIICPKTNEVFRLKKQSGQTYSRYDFWHDIERLQELVGTGNGKKRGFVLFLTNDKSYWDPRYGAVENDFKTSHGRIFERGSVLTGNIKGKNKSVKIDYNYKINWEPYGEDGILKYLLVAIPPI